MGGLALGSMLPNTAAASSLSVTGPQFKPKAKRVIHIFLNGGPSHVDTFDPKPSLQKYAGKLLPMKNLRTERKTGAAFPCPYTFRRYGQSGTEVSSCGPFALRRTRLVLFLLCQNTVPVSYSRLTLPTILLV